MTEVLQNVTTMRDILPSPVRRMVLEDYGFTPQAPAALGASPEPDSATTATAPAPVVAAPIRRIVAPLSFEPCHDDITGIIDALAAMPPPSAVDALEDVDKPDTVPAPVPPVILVSDSGDISQPTDVEPDDAPLVVSQASAMADARQSAAIMSSAASTTSVVPGSSSTTPARVVRGRINKPHPRRRPPPRALPPGAGVGRKDIRSEFFADLEASVWPPIRPTVGHVDLAKYMDMVSSASTVLIAHTVSTKFKLNRRQAATLRRRCAAMAAMEEVLVRKVQRTLPPPGADDEANAAAINQLREWCMVRHSRPDVPPFE